MYTSEKIFRGYSTCFRQWKATHSHCSKLHGYALEFKIVFGCKSLDKNNWCLDFGNNAAIKQCLNFWFDHTTVIAEDDPNKKEFDILHTEKVIDLRIVKDSGCEKFAEKMFNILQDIIDIETSGRVYIQSVTCIENGTNSATYKP